MIFYLSVAAGGAIGSVLRAWVAILVARATGPEFPWGTILINIAGSFIIGFFGTLTTNESRFAVATDVRAFVMIGICGGFTTFSSFSLQTLDLARDGRVMQAMGNVVGSVVLCLLAVTAGFYAAAAVHRTYAVSEPAGETAMGDVVVAVLNRPEEARGLLNAGSRLLGLAGGGRLRAVAVRMPPAATILPSEEVLTASREAAIRASQEEWAGRLHGIVRAWSPPTVPAVRTDWVDVEGDAAAVIAGLGRRADAIVISRPGAHESERMHDCLHAALFDTECPVLIVPAGFDGPAGQVVAIAWKDDERAVKAVRAALPILRAARAVHVLSANRPADLPAILREHDIAATLHDVPAEGGPAAERILTMAHALGADLLVMGAYAHGAWREALFGGVTRYVLAHADLPVLMRH